MFEVGKTYETKNHGEFECIAVTETHAWMKTGGLQAAYVWTQDGKSVSINQEYDIKPKPRDFWITNNDGFAHDSLESAERDPLTEKHGFIHVREVLDEC